MRHNVAKLIKIIFFFRKKEFLGLIGLRIAIDFNQQANITFHNIQNLTRLIEIPFTT